VSDQGGIAHILFLRNKDFLKHCYFKAFRVKLKQTKPVKGPKEDL
jgi:hypothetical protein